MRGQFRPVNYGKNDMKYYIYKLTNNADHGKSYIGQTTNPKQRWYPQKYKGAIGKAISEFGWENFTKEILWIAEDPTLADKYEDAFIFKYDTLNPRHGYNLQRGGTHTTENHREVLSRSAKKRWKDPSQREHQSKQMKGKKWKKNARWEKI